MSATEAPIKYRLKLDAKREERVFSVYGMTLRYPIDMPAISVKKDIREKVWQRMLKDEYVSWSN